MNRIHVLLRGLAPITLGVALSLARTTTAAAAPLQRADTTVITGRVTSEGGIPVASIAARPSPDQWPAMVHWQACWPTAERRDGMALLALAPRAWQPVLQPRSHRR